MCVLHKKILSKSVVLMVCEHDYVIVGFPIIEFATPPSQSDINA